MKKIQELKIQIEDFEAQTKRIALGIALIMDNFDNNPAITRLPTKGCFIINKSDLNKNLSLSPFDYDYKVQYGLFKRYLLDNPTLQGIEDIERFLSQGFVCVSSVEDGYRIVKMHNNNKVKLAESVRTNLKSLF